MNIAVIGTGNVGSILGTRWASAGHQVIYGTREPDAPKVQALLTSSGSNVRAVTVKEATAAANVIVLTVPYAAVKDTLESMGSVDGKILIDTTNPLKPDFSSLEVTEGGSAGETIALWARGAHVVKAFNTVGTRVMEDPQYGEDNALLLICGDQADAKDTATELAKGLGFHVIDTGPLSMSRHLESFAMLWINLAFVQNMGTDFGLKILTR